MRKLLTLISAVGLGATGTVAASNVVSCSKKAANDLGKIKGEDLKITIDDKKNNTTDYVKDTILAKIKEKVLIDKDGKEVKKDDKGILTFVAKDFTFKIGDEDFAFPTDLTKAFDVVVAPVTGDAATDNSKALKGSATFNVTPKSDDEPAPTPSEAKDLTKVIKTKDLGAITMAADSPTGDEIVTAINAKNKDANLAKADLKIENVTATGAKISGKDATKYTGEVTVTFSKAA